MKIYSIDLGIDPAATHGHAGLEEDPYPMQISVCSGVIENGDFVPQEVSSWFMFVGGDQLLVRIFDLGDPENRFTPTSFELSLCDLAGHTTDKVWTTAADFGRIDAAPSLCFANPDSDLYPCFRPLDSQGGAILYPLADPATRIRRLLTLRAVAEVGNPADENRAAIHFKSDPEVIVSPYGG